MKKSIRLIARLDIKSENVIKGVAFEGLRVIGSPKDLALEYTKQGADELLYIDTVASLYGRNNLTHILKDMSKAIDIPITAGGGITSLKDIDKLLRAGADKVAINTHAVKNPDFIVKAVEKYGSQCIVASIVVKKSKNETWKVWTDNAREVTNIDALDWITKVQELGVGEILLTSIDNDGTLKGLDFDLISNVSQYINVPLIVGGGFNLSDIGRSNNCDCSFDAIAIGSVLHYSKHTIRDIKSELTRSKFQIRSQDNKHNSLALNCQQKKVSIIDYGVGNIFGLIQSLEKIGANVNLIKTVDEIEGAERIILPGVGSFTSAMKALHNLKIVNALRVFAHSGKPIMGICLGAQILLERGFEGSECKGLSLIPGEVRLIERKTCKIPHIGWRVLNKEGKSLCNIFNGTICDPVYFVHSYEMITEEKYINSTVDYCNKKIISGVSRGNILGVQFHPEKSSSEGEKILFNFISNYNV
jgi:imidazole glycerol phosphate synthase glutamine amidotransferase subunit